MKTICGVRTWVSTAICLLSAGPSSVQPSGRGKGNRFLIGHSVANPSQPTRREIPSPNPLTTSGRGERSYRCPPNSGREPPRGQDGDGYLERLDAIREGFGYNPNVPGSKEAAEEQYMRYNRRVAEQLRVAGLYPGGDVNAYLRTDGDPTDQRTDREGGEDGRTSGPRNGR
jgi:hypothetical protein